MADDRQILVDRILVLAEDLFNLLTPNLSLDGLASDITVAQLRVLLALRAGGTCSMSAIASKAGVVPSTATGIVDNLVAKGLILREDDPEDRRRVNCKLSPEGWNLVNGLWTWGRSQIESLLMDLTIEQLTNSYHAAEILKDTAVKASH